MTARQMLMLAWLLLLAVNSDNDSYAVKKQMTEIGQDYIRLALRMEFHLTEPSDELPF